jgi:hypothetical protein
LAFFFACLLSLLARLSLPSFHHSKKRENRKTSLFELRTMLTTHASRPAAGMDFPLY